jgi:hypothetical protein
MVRRRTETPPKSGMERGGSDCGADNGDLSRKFSGHFVYAGFTPFREFNPRTGRLVTPTRRILNRAQALVK